MSIHTLYHVVNDEVHVIGGHCDAILFMVFTSTKAGALCIHHIGYSDVSLPDAVWHKVQKCTVMNVWKKID
jgi:hypothetical protein